MKDEKSISDWLNEQPENERELLDKFLSGSAQLQAPEGRSKAEAWDLLVDRINTTSEDNERVLQTEPVRTNRWIWLVASAAAIFLIGYFGIRNTPQPSVFNTQQAQLLTHDLPDNSIVTLNASSSISYVESKWEKKREVVLNGEAYFEVEDGSKFEVMTNLGSVEVLGTSFNVFSRPDRFQVACATGKVAVRVEDQEWILNPGEAVQVMQTAETTQFEKTDINVSRIGAWRLGNLYFEAIPLKNVILEMERQFDIKFNLNVDIKERFYSGFFSKNNLTEALQLVFIPMGLSYEIDGKEVNVN